MSLRASHLGCCIYIIKVCLKSYHFLNIVILNGDKTQFKYFWVSFMNELIIYDSDGISTFLILQNGRIVDFNGINIGFKKSIHVYDYNGNHRGFLKGGILRDHKGFTVGFTDNITTPEHPILPIKQLSPSKPLPERGPLYPFTEFPPLKPLYQYEWSDLTPIELFAL